MRAALRSLFFLLLAGLSLLPALMHSGVFAWRYDWRYFEAMGEMSRRAVLFWHQAPLWNPYSCGGEVALANPQSIEASPTFALILLFGTALGFKLTLALHTFFALDGGYRLARRFGLSGQAALISACTYGLSGYMALHFAEGHVTFLGVTLYPYLLLAYDRALDDTAWAIPTGMCAYWILSLGGTFTPPMAAEMLLVWAVLAAIERRSLRPFWLLAVGGVVAFCCGAVRMLPVLQFIKDHPRPPFMRAPDWAFPWDVLADLVMWRELAAVPGRKYWGHEYSARLAYAVLPLWLGAFSIAFYEVSSATAKATRAAFAARTERTDASPAWLRSLLAPIRFVASLVEGAYRLAAGSKLGIARKIFWLTLFAIVITMGNFAPFAPWSLLQKLPVMRDLRVPTRHLILVALGLSLMAGMAWDTLQARLVERHGPGIAPRLRRLGSLLVFLVAADGALFTALHYRDVYVSDLTLPTAAPRFYHVQGGWQSMREVLFSGHGSLGCDEEAPLQRAEALDIGDVPQERLLDPDAGTVVSSTFSPSARTVVVDLKRPTLLLVNSNWNEHWTLAAIDPPAPAARITKVAGRLAVDLSSLPPGRVTLTVRYAPRTFVIGALISLVSIPTCLILFAVLRRRRRAAVVAAPQVVAAG